MTAAGVNMDPAFAEVVSAAARHVIELKDATLPPVHHRVDVAPAGGSPLAVRPVF